MKREITIFVLLVIALFGLLVIFDYIFSSVFNWRENALQAVFTLTIIRFLMWVFNLNKKKSKKFK